eukprot:TRINITY_DN5443_c1_g2_i1.p1 TRINITY_DN5443_c1_g2~~TRINITY_DN5443_c1_g2_i1.p1  ORF type:complete len:1098 (-),score=176.09 TRINITY_DN5443_c1_g2_i1:84-3377(-)
MSFEFNQDQFYEYFANLAIATSRAQGRRRIDNEDESNISKFEMENLSLGRWIAEDSVNLKYKISSNRKFQLEFRLKKPKGLCIYYGREHNFQYYTFRINIKLKDILKIMRDTSSPQLSSSSSSSSSSDSIAITLAYAPQVYYKLSTASNKEWVRATSLSEATDARKFGKCKVLRFSNSIKSNQLIKELEKLENAGFKVSKKHIKYRTTTDPTMDKKDNQRIIDIISTFPEIIEYHIHCLISWGNIDLDLIDDTFIREITKHNLYNKNDVKLVVSTLVNMFSPDGHIYFDPTKSYIEYEKKTKSIIHDKNIFESSSSPSTSTLNLIKRTIITPTKTFFVPASLEGSNRITRKFHDHVAQFMRVSFEDESFERLFIPKYQDITVKMGRVLTEGVMIGGSSSGSSSGRRSLYRFLGVGSSQLRESQFWAFMDSDTMKASTIRRDMGDFSRFNVVGKLIARMGQCFSTTVNIREITEDEIETIPDVERNGYTFSDGVGRISHELAKEITTKMKLKCIPSAFQIRLKGAKGMLAVYPNMRKGINISLRKSMIKFMTTSTQNYLEIISYSRPNIGTINRQVISILDSLQVGNKITMYLENKMKELIKNLDDSLIDKQIALDTLKKFINKNRSAVLALQTPNFECSEPYIQSQLRLTRAILLRDLRKKHRMIIDDSRVLFGVMDETGSLSEGEVFIQYSTDYFEKKPSQPKVCVGNVIVCKHPVLHPGDVRKFKSVDYPELHHLVDVIVFPSKGYRPHPDELSGSDLDGDEYFATWDKEIVGGFSDNYTPNDYSAIKKPAPEEQIVLSLDDIKEFFIKYQVHDLVGRICNAHLAMADKLENGVKSIQCIELAVLHSVAVDFAKTSVPAKIPPELIPREYPEYIDSKGKKTYTSTKVLGRMFQSIVYNKISDLGYFDVGIDKDIVNPDDESQMSDVREFLERARSHRNEYEASLSMIMKRYGIRNEVEATTVTILSSKLVFHKRNNFQTVNYALKEFNDSLQEQYQNKFWEEFLEDLIIYLSGDTEFQYFLQLRVMAKGRSWYYVVYAPEERDFKPPEFLSFAWINAELLCQLKRKSDNFNLMHVLPIHILKSITERSKNNRQTN